MAPRRNKSTPITIPDIWHAARLARDHAISEWEPLSRILREHTGKPITRRELYEAVRKGLQPRAAAKRRRACQAVKDTMAWATSPAAGPAPDLPNQPPPPPHPQLTDHTAAGPQLPRAPGAGRAPSSPEPLELAEPAGNGQPAPSSNPARSPAGEPLPTAAELREMGGRLIALADALEAPAGPPENPR